MINFKNWIKRRAINSDNIILEVTWLDVDETQGKGHKLILLDFAYSNITEEQYVYTIKNFCFLPVSYIVQVQSVAHSSWKVIYLRDTAYF